MRHRLKTVKLQRKTSHRKSLTSNQVCSLIEHNRIKTTLAKAKSLRPFAEKVLTLAKKANACEEAKDKVHHFRQALSFLKHKKLVKKLFEEIAPAHKDRNGGYTRILKLGQRFSDCAPMALIEWVDFGKVLDEGTEDSDAESESKDSSKEESKEVVKTASS